jgi:hypothetical protein
MKRRMSEYTEKYLFIRFFPFLSALQTYSKPFNVRIPAIVFFKGKDSWFYQPSPEHAMMEMPTTQKTTGYPSRQKEMTS